MPSVQGIWTRLASGIEPLQRSSQCLSIIGNTAYVFCGELEPRKPRDNVTYSVALDATDTADKDLVKTVSAASPPRPRVGAASTTVGDKFYCFGGRGGVSMTCLESNGTFDVFDTRTASWSVMTPAHTDDLPEDRSYHSMTSDNSSTIFLHAGCPAKGRVNDLWALDIPTSTWKQLPSAPGGGLGGTSIAYSSTGKLYRINGFDGKNEQGGAVDVYNIQDGKWSSIEYKANGEEGPEPRSVAALICIKTTSGKEMLVTMFGEGSPSELGHAGAGRMFSDVWAFDVSAERWHRVEFEDGEPAPAARGWFAADVWAAGDGPGGRIVVQGGLSESNERLGDVWVLQIV